METFELMLIVPVLALGLGLLAFWIWMLVDCVTKESNEGYDRLVWLLVIIFTKLIGAAVYYFVRRPQRMRLQAN